MLGNPNRMYLVTGAAGHVGNVVIGKLLRRGETVRGLMLPDDHSVRYDGRIEIVYGDVRDRQSLLPFFENPEGRELIVIHTAGIVSIASRYQQKVYDVNVNGTKNIAELCLENNVARLVHVSSVHAIPVPEGAGQITEVSAFRPGEVSGLYASTKAEATQYVLDLAQKGLNVSIVHPSGIIGPGDHGHAHLTQMIIDYLNGSLVACVRGGYDFVDVRDVAGGILACAEKGKPGECYILSGHFCEIPELLRILHELTGRKQMRSVLPIWFARVTAPFSEIYYRIKKRPPLYTAYSMETLQTDADFSFQKAAEEWGYAPRPLEDTLRDTSDWLIQTGRVRVKPDRRSVRLLEQKAHI